MAQKLVRPYKISRDTWKLLNADSINKDNNGRQIFTVGIGEILEGSRSEEIYEDIYKDIIIAIFKAGSQYKINMTLGRVPQLTITYGGNLVLHNPEMVEIAQNIRQVIIDIPKEIVYLAFSEMRMNKEMIEKRGSNTKLLLDYVNQKCNSSYSVELVAAIFFEQLCEDEREMENEVQEQIKEMDYCEFVKFSTKVFAYEKLYIGKENIPELFTDIREMCETCEFEDIVYYVKEESYYRVLQGFLTEGNK